MSQQQFLIHMRNPFLNTDHYAVVQEYNKINSKKRSYSNSSQSSNWSTHSSRVNDHAQDYKDSTHKRRFNQEYLIPNSRSPVYEIEKRRAQVFGIEELRYKPAYFQQMNTNHTKNQHKGKESKKVIPQTINKYPKSSRQIKFMSPSSHSIKPQEQQRENKSVEPVKIDRILQVSPPVMKRRTSVLEELVQINTCNAKQNQFYASIVDLKSKHQLFRSSLNSQGSYQNSHSNQRNKMKKCSVFHDQSDKFHEIVKQMSEQFQYQEQLESQRSKMTDSKRLFESQCGLKDEAHDFYSPQVITVRQRKYFLYKNS